jgi:apolipoprotein N-acyltransferase
MNGSNTTVVDASVVDETIADEITTTDQSRTSAATKAAPLPLSFLAGLLATLSVPPFGWWPLAPVGIALLYHCVDGATLRRRLAVGFLFGLALYGGSLWWMTAFSLPGGIIVAMIEATFTAIGLSLVSRRALAVTFPFAIVAAEWLRAQWPFGGLPLGGLDLGQANGPLAKSVGSGGRLLLVGLTGVVGVGLAMAVKRRFVSASVAIVGVALVALLCALIPDGTHFVRTLKVAAVQGGGPRGLRKSEQGTARAYARHVQVTESLRRSVDLVLWPENIVDVEVLKEAPQYDDLKAFSKALKASLVVGVTESGNNADTSFYNEAVVINRNGSIGDRFDKVRRVPYGEYFPFRSFISNFAALPARDAIAGTKVGLLRTNVGKFAVSISYEGFFADRSRGGVRAGGEAILIPTNASSYATSQVPTQQVAAAQLRALETGRWVIQAAPTGRSAFIDSDGNVILRSVLEKQQLLVHSIEMRSGFTLFVRFGDWPMILLTLCVLIFGYIQVLRDLKRRANHEGLQHEGLQHENLERNITTSQKGAPT